MALSYIRKIYEVESEGRKSNSTTEELCILRQEKTKPILEKFYEWLSKKSLHVVPKSLLGKAVSYTLSQWKKLEAYLEHADVTPDNNAAENAIRPFVVGRKNWLFAGSPKGAEASAGLYSLIESAKANGLEPYKYLRYLFEHLPFVDSDDGYERLLPSNLDATDLELGTVVTGV